MFSFFNTPICLLQSTATPWRRWKVKALPTERENRLSLILPPHVMWAKKSFIPNWTILTRKKHRVPLIVNALLLLTLGTISIPISPKFSVIIRPRHQAVCGLLFAGKTQMFLGLHWPPQSPILSFTKALHSLCLFTSSLGPTPPWVGGNGWTGSYPTRVS